MRNLFKFCLCLLLPFLASAQDQSITGTVTSQEDNSPIPGVNVLLKGTTTGAQTDVEGRFSLTIPANATLVFSYVGFTPQEVAVGNRTVVDVTLATDVKALNEVVVVGYGTQRKRDVTGSITSLKGEDITDKPFGNPLNGIQGKAAGVTVTSSGAAGSSPTIRIRGVGSISNTNPLYVVDGIFADNIDFVNPNDIASMEILKDPSSLAMFGVQGANGVIIVTTKRAKKGETNINVSSYAGFQQVTNQIDLANADQFKTLYNEQLTNLGKAPFDFSPYTANTDWQDRIFRQAFINNNSVSITTATERNQASFSLNYFQQDGVLKYDAYKRWTAHLRDEFTINKNLKVGGDINLFRWDRDPATANVLNALWAAPVYDPGDATTGWTSAPAFQKAQVGNPVAITEINKGTTQSHGYRFVGSGFAELTFLKDFTWKSVFYTDLGFNEDRVYTPRYIVGRDSAQYNYVTGIKQAKDSYTTWQMDHTLTYTKNFNEKHDLTILAGLTSQYKGFDKLSGTRQGLTADIPNNPDFWYLNIGTGVTNERNNGEAEEQAFQSYLFRANYSYAGKYLLNVSYRRDGTSKFSPDNRWGNFPAVGAGWILSEEGFFQNQKVVNFLKLKGSWGRLGNDKVGNYLFYPVLNTGVTAVFGENAYPAAVPSYLPNRNIHWEVMEGTDFGVELMAFNNRLHLEADYYNRKTRDILVKLDIPSAVGAPQSLTNAGTILNRGVEVTLSWGDKISENWGYSISANATTIHNEVLSIGENIGYNITSGPSRTAIGYPVGAFYGYVQEGIFQTEGEVAGSPQATTAKPGDIRYKDVSGDGKFDDKDRTFIGSPTPDFIYGGSLGLTYKNFELGIDLQGVVGNEIYKQRASQTFSILNYEANRLGRWTGPGTSTHEPILDNTRSQNFQISDYFLEPGDYFRIRNVSLAYRLTGAFFQKLHIKGGKVYVNAQNLATFTKATGYSPEVGGESPVSFGIDNGTYPVPAVYTVGFNLNF